MRRSLRLLLGGAALLATACAKDSPAPTETPNDAGLLAAAIDPSLGATAGQAALPGLTMEPATTYEGSVSSAGVCTWSADAGRIVCPPVTRDGLTITRSIAFYDAAGHAQTHRDSTTASSNTQVAVKGTTTTGKETRTVDRSSSLTVSGLGRGATTHTMNGTESGTVTRTVTSAAGTATIAETFSAATKDVVVPVPQSRGSWPLSGTATRSSTLTLTRGGATRTSATSETVTFTGTSVVKVVVTRDGRTRTCTRDLAAHTQSCS